MSTTWNANAVAVLQRLLDVEPARGCREQLQGPRRSRGLCVRAFGERFRESPEAVRCFIPAAGLDPGCHRHAEAISRCHHEAAAQPSMSDMIRVLLISGSLALTRCESTSPPPTREPASSSVHHLEFVCRDVDEQCEARAKTHHATFGPEIPGLGGARVDRAADSRATDSRAADHPHLLRGANIADAVASAELPVRSSAIRR